MAVVALVFVSLKMEEGEIRLGAQEGRDSSRRTNTTWRLWGCLLCRVSLKSSRCENGF